MVGIDGGREIIKKTISAPRLSFLIIFFFYFLKAVKKLYGHFYRHPVGTI